MTRRPKQSQAISPQDQPPNNALAISPPKSNLRTKLQTISAAEFAGRFANGVRDNQQSFTWFLGAGCSRSSGILDAGGLVLKWLSEQHKLQATKKTIEDWIKTEFPEYDIEHPAQSYARVFERRHPSPVERQREIEMICARGEPAYGYATLAQLLSHKDYGRHCNTVLTTNFDDLIADALYLYGERHARPLVVTHEALARYVRTNSPRPTIVKLHGDAHLDPKNLQPETREIDGTLCKQLYPFLQDHALIFVGYGGNDESILRFVQGCPTPALAPPIYWVSKRDVPARFNEWLLERNALRVDHTDFDQLMHLIRNALSIELIERTRWNQIGDIYYEAFQRLKEEIDKLTVVSEDTQALRKATSTAQETLSDDWYFVSKADPNEKSNPDEANRIYQEGLEKFPNSRVLNLRYALFLETILKELDGAEKHYKRAIEADPNHSQTLAFYADFLDRFRRDPAQAETYYQRAIAADPNFSYALNRYAIFLEERRKDPDVAETYFRRAIEAAPSDAFALTRYAMFSQRIREDMDAAETLYKRAIKANPSSCYALIQYADFLRNIRQDMDAAETQFRSAIEADPKYRYARTRYADFLQAVRNDMDAAEFQYKKAIEADPSSGFALRSYARFLQNVRQDMDGAEAHLKKANELDPNDALGLRAYASFLEKVRKDPASAKTYWELAKQIENSNATDSAEPASR